MLFIKLLIISFFETSKYISSIQTLPFRMVLETISPRHLIIFIRQRWAVFLLIELYSWDAVKVASFVNWITKSSHFFWLFFVLASIVPVIAVKVLLQFLHLNLCLPCLIPSLLNSVLLQ